jgi:hypothetical protein
MSVKIDLTAYSEEDGSVEKEFAKQIKANKARILQTINRLQEQQEITAKLFKTILSYIMENESLCEKIINAKQCPVTPLSIPNNKSTLPDFLSKVRNEISLLKKEMETKMEAPPVGEFSALVSIDNTSWAQNSNRQRASKSSILFSFGDKLYSFLRKGEENIDDDDTEHVNINNIYKPRICLKDESIKYKTNEKD